MKDGTEAFLRQAYRNNWQRYLSSLQLGAHLGWDVCVLTASDERQATMYRRQLALRQEAGLLPTRTRFVVVADPNGQRIGSGGATLRVLRMLYAPDGDTVSLEVGTPHSARALADKEKVRTTGRVLIIHSGGDSRRLPHCSAIGKLFARIPRTLPDARASTLFDEFLIGLSGVASELPPGVLIASGDVLLIFDHLQLDLQQPGVTGVAAAAPTEMGTHHGVYASADGGRRLRAYLHKPTEERLRHWDAISDAGTVDIDTGLVWLDAGMVQQFLALAQEPDVAAFCGKDPAGLSGSTGLNLYGDLLLPLAESTTLDDYLSDTSDGMDTPAVRAARQVIWDHVRGVPFAVERLQPAAFLHFGTSREYWALIADSPEMARTFGWTQHTASWLSAHAQPDSEGLATINAVVTDKVTRGTEPALVIDAHICGSMTLSGPALVAGLCTEQSLALQADVVLHQVPLAAGFATRIYGLYDDPKRSYGDPTATFMNRLWGEWLAQAGLDANVIWPGVPAEGRTLWNARLYPVTADREESLAFSLPLQDPANAPADWRARWAACDRLSLAESFARAEGEQILAELSAIEDEVSARHFYAAIEAERPAAEVKSLLGSRTDTRARRGNRVAAWLEKDDPILRLRGYKALAEATEEEGWEDRAFATLATMIEDAVSGQRTANHQGGPDPWQLTAHGTPVCVEAAARIDFGGGWTDTPPYSIERGGTVLNAAVTLEGQYPILIEAEGLPEPRLVLESQDIGSTLEPARLGQVLSYANPADPFALLKAALVLRGIVPADGDPNAPLEEILRGQGGLRLSTQTIIPRGSGLGTSSILAGAVLACLARLQGVELAQDRLFDEVLCLEQMLTTGGGWQDQVGGLTGGIKLVTTEPGLPQQIEVAPVQMSPDTRTDLADRLHLVYTGQQRLAKNLLRTVVRRWMARDPEMVWIEGEIARLAVAMRDALEAGDVSGFGTLLSEHWALNKRIDPGCTNPFIDGLFEAMVPYIDGGKLAGAGGGGFAIVVARDRDAAGELSAALKQMYLGAPVGVWPCAIPDIGMVLC